MRKYKGLLQALWLSALALAAVVTLTMPFTLAKYAAGGTGSAAARVASWNPLVTDNNSLKGKILLLSRDRGWHPFGWDTPGSYWASPGPGGPNPGGNCLVGGEYTLNNTNCEVSARYTVTLYRARDDADGWDTGIFWSGYGPDADGNNILYHPQWSDRTTDMTPGQGAVSVVLYPQINALYQDSAAAGFTTRHAYFERIYYAVDAAQID